MAQATITFFDGESTPTTDAEIGAFVESTFYAVGWQLYNKSRNDLEPVDVTVLPHRAHPAAISGATTEVRVELASDDWLYSKPAYDELARGLHRRLITFMPPGDTLFVWVTGGPFTGFAQGRRALDS